MRPVRVVNCPIGIADVGGRAVTTPIVPVDVRISLTAEHRAGAEA